MQRVSLALAVVGTVMLGGCSLTLPVRGQVSETTETFTGTATGYMDGAGDLTITTNQGATCTGAFVYVNRRQGEGTFTCNDGRTGPFTFVSTGQRGTGTGRLGDKPVTFTFGSI